MHPMDLNNCFFKKLKQRLDQEVYKQVIMMGNFNGVINTEIDKQPEKKSGKLPKIFVDLREQESLVDTRRNWNPDHKDFTYYSPAKRNFPG